MRRILLSIGFVVLGVLVLLRFDTGAHTPAPGEPIGDVQAMLSDGSAFQLAQAPHEVIVVNFWATWCAPCKREVPLLNELHAQGVRIVGLVVDALPVSTLHAQAANFGINYPVGIGLAGLPERLGVQSIPTTFVVRADRRIARTLKGEVTRDELRAAIVAASTQ